ncbi:hypothetical protein RYH80_13610 [Halobaculum sp. MBLA0147]|uniref:hypothetical protein n=1 Tax=Halobaculum sp. MBLA0147 TaxID=3079934 RepID=UPI0035262247
MKVKIVGEDDEGVGVRIADNAGVEQQVELYKSSGEAFHHDADEYAESPEDRAYEANEHVAQGRRLAKYYVYRKRRCDTLPPLPNPDRLATVAAVIAGLSDDRFEQYFDSYYRQFRGYSGECSPVVEVPPEAEGNPIFFETEVYLSLTTDEVRGFLADGDEPTIATLREGLADAVAGDIHNPEARLRTARSEDTVPEDAEIDDLALEAVSDVQVMWSPASNEKERVGGEIPDIDRKPDAKFQLAPFHPESRETFRGQLLRHLRYQIRDCYLTMGIAPPEPFRVQGPGLFNRCTWFQHYDVYEPYHRTDVDITDWQVDETPDELL